MAKPIRIPADQRVKLIISVATRKRLARRGSARENYNDIIVRLMKQFLPKK